MRLILAALMVGCFAGQAAASIELSRLVQHIHNTMHVGGSTSENAISTSSYTEPVSASGFRGSATRTAEVSSLVQPYVGNGVTTDHLFSATGHTFANTTGSSSTLDVTSIAGIDFYFTVNDATAFDLSLSGGDFAVRGVTDLVPHHTASGATSDSFVLQPGHYVSSFLWTSYHENGDLPAGVLTPFSGQLGFNGALTIFQPVPEASSIAAWSALALMGLVSLPLTGRVRSRLRLRR